MNPRDTDAFYDAIKSYMKSRVRENQSTTWRVEHDIAAGETYRDFSRELLGRWKLFQDEDARYADEREWITDAFKAEVTYLTEERDRYPGFAPKRKKVRSEDLQAGDTTELDSFLLGFSMK